MFVNAAGEDTPIDVVPAMDDSVYSFPGNPLQTIQHRAYANTRLLCCRNFEVFTRKRWTFPNESYIGVYYKNTGSWLFYKLLRLFGCSFVYGMNNNNTVQLCFSCLFSPMSATPFHHK